ncbi:MAG: hypothetical protein U5K72_18380 [Balneolaceae bacterium]|nr:hypothetical protein [Balneolaceae bacterium]
MPDFIVPIGAAQGEVNLDNYFVVPEYTGGGSQLQTFNRIVRANHQGTNWYDEIFDPALTMNHNLSISGGGEQGNFLFSHQ